MAVTDFYMEEARTRNRRATLSGGLFGRRRDPAPDSGQPAPPQRTDEQGGLRPLVIGLGGLSVALGVFELLAGRQLADSLGMYRRRGWAGRRLLRVYGLREIATGIGLLAARNPTPWLWARVAGDVLDAATLAPGLGAQNRYRGRIAVALGAVAGATALDLYAARKATGRGARSARRRDTAAGAVAVITGGSSGIGYEIARCFARDGYGLVIAASREDRLRAAAEQLRREGAPRVECVVADLSSPEGPQRLYRTVKTLGIEPDFLVNNAGAGRGGDFVRESDLEDELSMIRLNAAAVVELTKLFGRDMVRRGRGKILITSSIAARVPIPRQAVYAATKAFELAFAEAVGVELKGTGVTVTALLPNATATNFFRRGEMEAMRIAQGPQADPATVARAGYAAMMRGDSKVFAPFGTRLTDVAARLLPRRVLVWQAERFTRRVGA